MARENLQDVTQVNQLTNLQLNAGAAPRADVVRSSVDMANAQQSLVAAEGQEQSALAALNVLLARPPMAPLNLADNLSALPAPPDLIPQLPDLATLTSKALQTRSLVKGAKAQVQAADFTMKQTEASRYPDVSIDYERSVQMSSQSVVVALHAPILDFGSIRDSIKAAEEAERQAKAQEAQVEQQVAQQTSQAYTDYTQAVKLAASFQTDILQPSITLLSMAQLGYKQGGTGILPVLDAESTLRNARIGYVSSLQALYKARDEIDAAVGTLPEGATTTALLREGK
jgi:cobalt-zinc-cadmium efflux system outer membrane protein